MIRVVRDKSLEQVIYECGLRLLLILFYSYCDKQVLRKVDVLCRISSQWCHNFCISNIAADETFEIWNVK
jgi:hypothetical protein